MNKNKDQGFTLVELLIVIVILGILATVTVFAVRGITDQGETNACQTDKSTFETASEAWYALDNSQKTDADSDGHPTEQDLVDTELIREVSPKVDIVQPGAGATFVTVGPDGGATPTATSCTVAQLA